MCRLQKPRRPARAYVTMRGQQDPVSVSKAHKRRIDAAAASKGAGKTTAPDGGRPVLLHGLSSSCTNKAGCSPFISSTGIELFSHKRTRLALASSTGHCWPPGPCMLAEHDHVDHHMNDDRFFLLLSCVLLLLILRYQDDYVRTCILFF